MRKVRTPTGLGHGDVVFARVLTCGDDKAVNLWSLDRVWTGVFDEIWAEDQVFRSMDSDSLTGKWVFLQSNEYIIYIILLFHRI